MLPHPCVWGVWSNRWLAYSTVLKTSSRCQNRKTLFQQNKPFADTCWSLS